MALANGTKLGPYEIMAAIGAGGMGEVYRARDSRLDRTVAIKILPSHLSGDALRRQRFEREVKAISSLNHPHICTLHDIGRQDSIDFIVMEHLEGETLGDGWPADLSADGKWVLAVVQSHLPQLVRRLLPQTAPASCQSARCSSAMICGRGRTLRIIRYPACLRPRASREVRPRLLCTPVPV